MGLKFGDISPLAGIATGKGMMGKLAGSGAMGLAPAMIARGAQDDDKKRAMEIAKAAEDEKQAKAIASKVSRMPTPRMMAKGGSASKRADGIAQRGKTRA